MFEERCQDHLYKDLYSQDEAPPHPGEVLREDIFPKLGVTKVALAKALGVGARKLASFMAERTPVTFDMAQRLGVVLGHGPRYWLGLQVQHDLWRAAQPLPANMQLRPLVPAGRREASGRRATR